VSRAPKLWWLQLHHLNSQAETNSEGDWFPMMRPWTPTTLALPLERRQSYFVAPRVRRGSQWTTLPDWQKSSTVAGVGVRIEGWFDRSLAAAPLPLTNAPTPVP
jgi:hypothetical protein